MKKDFNIIAINEIPFKENDSIKIDDKNNIKEHLSLSIVFVLQYQESTNVIGLHAAVRYLFDEEVYTEGGATFIVDVNNWESFSHDLDYLKEQTWLKELVSFSYAFIGGQHFEKNRNTPISEANLPYIPVSDLLENIRIEKIEK